MSERFIIGLMSGTSADGVDGALVKLTGHGASIRAELIDAHVFTYSRTLQQEILDARQSATVSLQTLARLTRELTLAHAHCAAALIKRFDGNVTAIAAHGQTMFHAPPLSIQLFDPSLLAYACGADVVSDFRRADLAAGGQGAPLVPFADWVLFRSHEARTLVNIGGISNVTVLPRNSTLDEVRGFDTGPGNCVSDHLMRDHGGVDTDGDLASRGTVNEASVRRFLACDYVTRPAPKSTDGPAMIDLFNRAIAPDLSLPDRLATAAKITAECIVSQTPPGKLIVAGGGVYNRAIMHHLASRRAVVTTDALGVPAQSREAIAFAILGAMTLDNTPANIPTVTGAREKVVLGSMTRARGTDQQLALQRGEK